MGKPSNTFNNEFDHFLAGVEIGFLASTWGLSPLAWPWQITGVIYLGFTPLAWGLPP